MKLLQEIKIMLMTIFSSPSERRVVAYELSNFCLLKALKCLITKANKAAKNKI